MEAVITMIVLVGLAVLFLSNVFRQAKIVTPHTVPKYFSTFRDATMYKINQFKFLPKVGAVETALKALQPNVRFTLDDVVELPPFIARMDQVQMGAKQTQIYAAVKRDCYALVQSGAIKAANAGAVSNVREFLESVQAKPVTSRKRKN